jgi:hypothetical protein
MQFHIAQLDNLASEKHQQKANFLTEEKYDPKWELSADPAGL